MAIKVAVHRVCDRCQQDFEGQTLKYSDGLPKFITKSTACAVTELEKVTVLFLFEDLCPECDRVVDGLIRRIRMEDGADSKPAKKAKKTEKTPEATTSAAPAKEARFEPESPVVEVTSGTTLTAAEVAAVAPNPDLPPASVTPAPAAESAAPHLF